MTFNAPSKKFENTQTGLRDRLFEAMDALRKGDIEYQDASALAKISAQIINSHRVEIELDRHRASLAKDVTPTKKIGQHEK